MATASEPVVVRACSDSSTAVQHTAVVCINIYKIIKTYFDMNTVDSNNTNTFIVIILISRN